MESFEDVSLTILASLGYSHTAKEEEYNAGPVGGKEYMVKAGDIDKYFTPNFWVCFSLWYMFHQKLGLPFSGGWADQPYWIVNIISKFQDAFNAEENEKHKRTMEKNQSKHKVSDSDKPKLLSRFLGGRKK